MNSNTLRRVCLSAALAFALCGTAVAQDQQFLRTTSRTPSFETDFTVAAEKTVNSVVCIQSYETPRLQYYGNPFGDFFDFFGWGMPQQQQPQQQKKQKQEPQQTGTGSGVIVSADGYIVTNHHVINGAEKLEVLLNDNSTYTATVIGSDEATDLALIKIDATDLKPIVFGNSDDVKIGEWVLAVGNPFGLNSTVTAGIISAKGRALEGSRQAKGRMGIESYLQTDAAINPGNSGGALVNLNGELIGINAAIYSRTGSYTGYSFAIPTTIVSKIVTDLKTYGSVQRGILGITCRSLDAQLAKEFDIKGTTTGVYVDNVEEGSTGADLGLTKKDIIVGINNATIHTLPELQERLSTLRPGDPITVRYYHDGKLVTRSATLKDSHGKASVTIRNEYALLGAKLEPLTDAEKKKLNVRAGLKVVDLEKGSLLAAEGVKKGAILLTVNDMPLRTEQDLKKAYQAVLNDDSAEQVLWITGLQPNSQRKFYCAIPLTKDE